MIDYKLIGKRLQHQRDRVKLTQEQVAEAAEITVVYLSKIENGKAKPTLETLDKICIAIGVDIGAVFFGAQLEQANYKNDEILTLFRACAPAVKPVAVELLRGLSEIQPNQ